MPTHPRCQVRTRLRPVAVAVLAALLHAPPAPGASTESARYYEDALRYYEDKDYEEASVQLKNALQADPDNLSARILLGRTLLRERKPRTAEAELRAALASGADRGLVLVPLGTAYLMQREYERLLEEIPDEHRDPARSIQLQALRAEAYMGLQELSEAEDAYLRLRESAPDHPSSYLGLAMINLERGRADAAEEYAREALRVAPERSDTWFVMGEVHRFRNETDAALEHYDRALGIEPGHVDARIRRAEQRIGEGAIDEGLADLDTIREESPDNPEANFVYALGLMRKGDVEGARRVIDDVSQFFSGLEQEALSSHGPALLLSGYVNFQQGHFEEAYAALIRYIQLYPVHVGARTLAARILLRKNEPLAAVDVLLPALGLMPGDATLHTLLGQAYMNSRQYSRAVAAFERAAELMPDSVSTRTALAVSRLGAGQAKVAEAELAAVLEMEGEVARPALLLGRIHLKRSEYRDALTVASKLAEREPENPAAYHLAGEAHIGLRDVDRAVASFRAALQVRPDYLPARVQLARIAESVGRREDAKTIYLEVLAADPQQTGALTGLAAIAEREGRIDEAIEMLERVAAIDRGAIAAQLRLAGLLIDQRAAREALAVVESLEGVAPDDALVVTALARTHAALGDRPRARTELRRAALLAGVNPTRLTTIARYQREFGDALGARRSLDKATRAYPAYVDAQRALIQLDLAEGKVEAAHERASQLRRDRPALAVADVLAGDALVGLGRLDEALEAYREALGKDDRLDNAVRVYQVLLASGDEAAALALLEAWSGRYPESLDGKRVLAGGYIDAGRDAEALALMQAVLEARPDDVTVLNNVAWLYHVQDDPRALEAAERAYEIAPEDPDVLDTLGWIVFEREDDPERALPLLRDAYSRRASDPTIRYHLAAVLARLGRKAEARRELQKLVAGKADFDEAADARRLLDSLL